MTFEMSLQPFLLAAIGLLLTIVSYLVQTKSQKKRFQQRISTWISTISQRRRTSNSNSNSKTPPRSLTPEHKVPSNGPPASAYKEVFPPSTRGNLPVWTKSWSSLLAGLRTTDGDAHINQVVTSHNVVSFNEDYWKANPSAYTPMGITIAEVKALGNFPNYAKLSGVPLPEAYKEHKLETAIPRPYRPFRWAYHQTMCKISLALGSIFADASDSFDQNGA